MKKLFILCAMSFVLMATSCTSNTRTNRFGGTRTITLEKGQKLTMATWKENGLWYLTEPMEEDYTPKTKVLQEESNLGLLEGKIIFVESK